jgi:hypothetical protein
VSSRITLQPGLRVDGFRGSTPGSDAVFSTNPVSPRFGLAWDVRADHRSVVRLHYGRYTDPAFSQSYLLTDQSDESPQTLARVVAPGVFEELSRSNLGFEGAIAADIEHSSVDQFVAGAEHQVFANTSLQVQYIYRRFDNFMAYVRDGARWEPVQRQDPGPDGVGGTADDGSMFTVYSLTNMAQTTMLYTNPENAWRRYHALQVVARKRHADRWQLQASYTWSRAQGTAGTQWHANSGIRTPVTGAGDPNAWINNGENLPHDPTNEAKVLGDWNPRWLGGFTLSGVYRYTTGAPWARSFVALNLAHGIASVLAEPRGTRRTESINNLDLRLEKAFPLGGRRHAGIFVDVFNVGNQGVADSDWGIPFNTSSGPNLGVPFFWRPPRQVRVAARVLF